MPGNKIVPAELHRMVDALQFKFLGDFDWLDKINRLKKTARETGFIRCLGILLEHKQSNRRMNIKIPKMHDKENQTKKRKKKQS